MAPKRKEIDWTLFEQLCAVQCTQSEIASMLKIHIDTLRDNTKRHYKDEYSNVYKKYCENGKCSLRRNQFVLSKKNAAMAIWLGKQWLGQRDHDKEAQENARSETAELQNEIMRLKHENKKHIEQISDLMDELHNKSKTGSELLRS